MKLLRSTFLLFTLLLSLPFTVFAMNEGFNFRATQGYVTDPTDTQFVGAASSYPITNEGVTFGWTSTTGLSSRNRSTTIDPRLAGIVFRPSGTAAFNDFRVDLEAPGNYDITIALGDYSFSQNGQYAEIYDDSTLLATVNADNAVQPSGSFFDASGTLHTAATFFSGQTPLTLSFSTTKLIVRIGTTNSGPGNDTLTHLNVASVASPVPARTLRLQGNVRLTGGIRLY